MARTPIFAEGDIYKSCLGDWEKLVQDATGKVILLLRALPELLFRNASG